MAIIQRKRSDGELNWPTARRPLKMNSEQAISYDSPSSSPVDSKCIIRRKSSERSVEIGSPDYSSLYASDTVIASSKSRMQRRPTYSFEKTERVQKMVWRAIYLVVILMWIGGYRHYHSTTTIYQDLLAILENDTEQLQESKEHMQILENQLDELQFRLDRMTQINDSFRHELRMIEEMVSEEVDMKLSENDAAESSTMSRWIRQRELGLRRRIYLLKAQVQEQSMRTVIEKYGPGPYEVKFTVSVLMSSQPNGFGSVFPQHKSAFMQNRATRVKKSFVVELAPIDVMPHAVHFFLDLVENKLWDDAVFLHNDESEHVMAAAPLDYVTHNLKMDRINALDFRSLSFPEYSPRYPHKEYTVGFAHKGPTIYVNTMDNTEHHGPGSQEHHLFPEDADPCFGTVTRGREVIDLLMSNGIQGENRLNPRASHPWKDQEDMFWTRIVSVEIL